ncbi:MAG TPA: hypothetical protein VMU19_06685 [Bryobacteraceae bacterium]|nr:hypothetical protein [Bryobacteraceae bacterium]
MAVRMPVRKIVRLDDAYGYTLMDGNVHASASGCRKAGLLNLRGW